MPQITYLEAGLRAISEEMRSDPRVFVMGQDMQAGLYGPLAAKGVAEFGLERIRDTPISETGFFGAAIGAAVGWLACLLDSDCG